MKELSIEDKAKRYDEVLAMAKECITYIPDDAVNKYMLNMFPELKESEDERIRKIITLCLNECVHSDIIRDYEKDDAIAWLEKQGNKPQSKSALEAIKEEKVDNQICVKPNDKVEPKFHKGEWVVANIDSFRSPLQIVDVDKNQYRIEDADGNSGCPHIEFIERHYHEFTISDAKDGDVLVASDGSIFICAGVVDCAYKYHVALTTDNTIQINKKVEGCYWDASRAVHPATKGETDFFFQKMHEAGYEWNAENKQLKKIEQKSVEWSEEDKNMLEDTIYMVTMQRDENRSDNEYQRAEKCIDWLKSLKDRVNL